MAEFDDFGLLAQMARRELVHLLESMPEVKDLAVESSLTRPLDKIASMSLLQQHNCGLVQQFAPFTNLVWGEQSLRRVYFVRPSIANARRISENIRAEPHRAYSVIFVPTKLYVCEVEFEKNGVYGMIDIHEMDLPLINIDSHLFTLELPDFTSSVLVDRTYTQLHAVAKSLWQLQSLYGLIPTVYGVGEYSAQTNRLMKKLYAELGEPRSSPDQPVSHLFLLDRNVDMTTVLLTGLTYESMLHDTFGISCGKVTFGDEVTRRMKNNDRCRTRVTTLDNTDAIFSTVRDMHMTAVFPFLSAKAKSLQASYDKGSRLEQVKQMKEFVSNELRTLKQQHKLLELHICACEVVLENCKGMSDRLTLEHQLVSGDFDSNEIMLFLENAMCRQGNQWQILLLACLWSVCQNGIPSKYYTQFRTCFLRAYGHEYLSALYSLSLQGLLVERTSPQLTALKAHSTTATSRHPNRPTFQFLSRRMNLVPSNEEVNLDLRSPNQMRYVFSGAFTPVLCQIVGDTVDNGWNISEMKKTFGDSKPRVYVAPGSRFEHDLKEYVPCLHKVFHPTWWCPFGFLQTAIRQLCRSRPSLPFQREIVSFEDGGQTAVDWMHPDGTHDESPIVIFLPGICGSTHDCSYILHAVIDCNKRGYRSVVVNPRGLGGVVLKTAQTYNAAWTSDLRHVIRLISRRYANALKIGCGFSMGGMVLWNYLAECTSVETSGLNGALCISSPFNPAESSLTVEKFFPRIFFNSVLAANLKKIVRPYKTMFEGRCNWEEVMRSKTVRDFDKAFTVPLFGYKDWNEYYDAAALYWKVSRIPIPTLCLNAADDCFSPINAIPFADIIRSENVAVAVTQHGGHTAFMRESNPNASGLVEDLIAQYSSMIFSRRFI